MIVTKLKYCVHNIFWVATLGNCVALLGTSSKLREVTVILAYSRTTISIEFANTSSTFIGVTELFFDAISSGELPSINTASGAGLANLYARQLRHNGFQFSPDPPCDSLAGRVLEPRDVIQVMVVQALVGRFKQLLQLGEIHHPACRLGCLPGHR